MSGSPKQELREDTVLNAFTVDLEDWYQGIELPFQSWETYSSRIEVGLYRILELLDQYGQWEKLQKSGREFVAKDRNWRASVERYCNVYGGLITPGALNGV